MKTIEEIKNIKKFISNNNLTLLYFSSPDCSVCKDLLLKIKNLLQTYDEISSAYINIKKVKKVGSEFSIFSMPTILFFIDGKETLRKSRYVGLDNFKKELDRYLKLYRK